MSARSSAARVRASTLSVFTFASAMRRVFDGLDNATSNPCSSSLSWIWIQRFPVDSTTTFTSSWKVVSLPENSSISSGVFANRISSRRVPSSSRMAAWHIFLWTSIPTYFTGVTSGGLRAARSYRVSGDQSGSRSGLAQSGSRVSLGPSARRA